MVARMLAERGAIVIDADDLARRAVEPGTHGYAEVIRRFGPGSLKLDGDLDREWLARRVFADPEARLELEAIVHPEVGRLFAAEMEKYRDTDAVVVFAVPLLVESAMQGMFDLVVTVEAPEDVRVARLVADRGMTEEAARDRIRAQASDHERRKAADEIVRNEGTLEELQAEVERLWSRLREQA